MPIYLMYYLNRESTQKFIKNNVSGTNMPVLSKSFIENLPIPIPHIDIQEKLFQIERLGIQEKVILNRVMELKQILINNAIDKYFNKLQ